MAHTVIFTIYVVGTVLGIAMGGSLGYYVGRKHGRLESDKLWERAVMTRSTPDGGKPYW